MARGLGDVGEEPAADAVAALRLGFVEGAVGALDDFVGEHSAAVGRGGADTDGHADVLSRNGRQHLFHLEANPLGDTGRAAVPGFGQNDHELVAAVAASHVRPAQDLLQPLADRGQDAVAAQVAMAIVDPLEVVDVEEHERDRVAGAARAGELHVEDLDAVRAVVTPGQRVLDAVVTDVREELRVANGDCEQRGGSPDGLAHRVVLRPDRQADDARDRVADDHGEAGVSFLLDALASIAILVRDPRHVFCDGLDRRPPAIACSRYQSGAPSPDRRWIATHASAPAARAGR